MDLRYSISEQDNLKTANRLLKFFVVVIGISVIYLTFKVTRTVEYQKTVLVPVFFDSKLEISGDDISDEGAEMYARRITALRANYSPMSVVYKAVGWHVTLKIGIALLFCIAFQFTA